MTNKILIIPDVHGRTFWKYAIDNIDKYDKVIFLGDYLDPYFWEVISFDFAISNFKEIIKFKRDNMNKVILLKGNHDWHYISLQFMDCSRLNYGKRSEMNQLFQDNSDLFQTIHIEKNFIFSHAAIHQEWLDKYDISIYDLKSQNFSTNFLEDISSWRGGFDDVGSCVWADINESQRHKLIDGYYQIVGHTQLESAPYITKNIACLDVRRPFSLNLETNSILDIDTNTEHKIYD